MHPRFGFFAILLVFILMKKSFQWRPFEKYPEISHEKIKLRHLSTQKLSVRNRIVDIHNHFRASVKPPAKNMLKLRWDKRAAKDAKRWTRRCRVLVHDSPAGRYVNDFGSCGQNIFISTHKVPWLYAIRSWYSEEKDFTYGAKSQNGTNDLVAVGHYTQMVWDATHRVGCAINKCFLPSKSSSNDDKSKGMTYYTYICNYCPIGNFMDRLGFPYQTGRQCDSCPDSCELATNREYKKKLMYKSKRSIPENEDAKQRDESPNSKQESVRKRLAIRQQIQLRLLTRRFCRNVQELQERKLRRKRISIPNKSFRRPIRKNLSRKDYRNSKRTNPITLREGSKRKKTKRLKRKKSSKRLCTNGCDYADMWMNCKDLASHWRDWLCNSRETPEGRDRFRNCKATCTCDPNTTITN